MQPITTAEQDHLLSKLSATTATVHAKYIDKSIMLQTVLIAMLKDLESGKPVRLISGDIEIKQAFLQLLDGLDLKAYAIDTDAFEHLDELAISLLRSNAKSKSFALPSKSALHQLGHVSQDIKSCYQQLSHQVQRRVQVRDLPQILAAKAIDKRRAENTVRIHKILESSSHMEHNELLSLTSELASRYDSTYTELACGELLTASTIATLTTEASYQTTSDIVNRYAKEATILRSRYEQLTATYERTFLSKIKERQVAAVQCLRAAYISSCELADEPIQKTGGLSIFKKSTKQNVNKYESLAQKVNSELTAIDSDWSAYLKEGACIDLHALHQYLSSLEETNQQIVQQQKANYVQVAKHLSLLNQQDEEWADLSVQLSGLLHRVAADNLLVHGFENNSQGLMQQLQLITRVANILQRAASRLLHQKSYYHLAAQLATSSLHQQIVDTMAFLLTKSWTTTLDKAYYDYYEQIYSQEELPSEATPLTEAHTLAVRHFHQVVDRVKSTIARQQRAVLAEIKTEHKLLYQSLVKKKLPSSGTSAELCAQYPEVAARLFPIQISSTAAGSDHCQVYAVAYGGEVGAIRLSASVFQQEDFDTIGEEKNYLPLYLNYYQYSGTLDKLTHTEKIKAAKKLAKQVLSISQELKIYQLKEANIISILPPQDDQYLETKLEALGAKVLHMDDIYLRLVESLLETGRPQHIVVKDGLIDAEHLDHFLYQYDVLQRCQDAGISVQSVYTVAQLQEGLRSPIDHLVTTIVGSPTIAKSAGTAPEVTEATTV